MKMKRASKDFVESDLPSSRKEVFFDCLKNRTRYLIRSGLILFLTLLPLMAITITKLIYVSSIRETYYNEYITLEEFNSLIILYTAIFDALIIVSMLIAALGVSGVTRVIRQIAWEEPLFYGRDFMDGIKMNYKQILPHLLFLSIIYMLSDLSLNTKTNISILQYTSIAIFILIIIPIALYNIVLVNVYNMSIFEEIKNSVVLLLRSAPISVVFALASVSIIFIKYIPITSIAITLYVLVLMFLPVIYYLLWFLYASSILDKYLNIDYYPEIVDKGIKRKAGYKKLDGTITKASEEKKQE